MFVVSESQTIVRQVVYDPTASPPPPVAAAAAAPPFVPPSPDASIRRRRRPFVADEIFVAAAVATPSFVAPSDVSIRHRRRALVTDAIVGSIGSQSAGTIASTIASAVGEVGIIRSQLVYDPTAAPPKFVDQVTAPPVVILDGKSETFRRRLKTYQLASYVFAIPDDIFGIQHFDQQKRVKVRILPEGLTQLPPQFMAAAPPPPTVLPDYWIAPKFKKRPVDPVAFVYPATQAGGLATTMAGAFGETVVVAGRLVYDLTTGPHLAPTAVVSTPTDLAFVSDPARRARRRVAADQIVGTERVPLAVTPSQFGFTPQDYRSIRRIKRAIESGFALPPFVLRVDAPTALDPSDRPQRARSYRVLVAPLAQVLVQPVPPTPTPSILFEGSDVNYPTISARLFAVFNEEVTPIFNPIVTVTVTPRPPRTAKSWRKQGDTPRRTNLATGKRSNDN